MHERLGRKVALPATYTADNMRQTICDKFPATDNMRQTTCDRQHATDQSGSGATRPKHPHTAVRASQGGCFFTPRYPFGGIPIPYSGSSQFSAGGLRSPRLLHFSRACATESISSPWMLPSAAGVAWQSGGAAGRASGTRAGTPFCAATVRRPRYGGAIRRIRFGLVGCAVFVCLFVVRSRRGYLRCSHTGPLPPGRP